MKETINRIKALEQYYNPEPLLVLSLDPKTGAEQVLPMKEFLKTENEFIKIVGGGSLEDLDLFLKRVKEAAFKACEDAEQEENGES